MEKYSVLMSLYKKEHPEYLKLAIDSMLNQTVKPDEIILVEDEPLTDELYAVVDEYKDKLTIVINKKNLGLGLALNEGLKVCRNELIARMDTDDISKPDRCEKQLKRFEEKPELAIVGSHIDEFVGDPSHVISQRRVPLTSEAIYNFAKKRSAFNHPVVMYKKSAVLEEGGYADLKRNQDVDLFGRMLFKGHVLYGSLLMMCKSGKSKKEINAYIDEYEKKYSGWEKSEIINHLGKAKAIFLRMAKSRNVLGMKTIAIVHSFLIGRA